MSNRSRYSATRLVCIAAFSLAIHVYAEPAPQIKVIAFDAFPIFDPRPIAEAAEQAFPGTGKELMDAWLTRTFQYQWLRALAHQYKDFMQAAEAALMFAANQLDLDLTAEKKNGLLNEFRNLTPWPDAHDAIRELRAMGVELVFLSNMTEDMLRDGLQRAGLQNDFKAIYSTDRVQSYKPAPAAYAMAVEELGISKEEILFVAFAGWDVAGAKWFGYPTFWLNRLNAPQEELDVTPDGTSTNLNGLVNYVSQHNAQHR